MDIILLANLFNAFGVFFGLTAHAYISLSKQEKVGHGLYVISCSLIIVGSFLLSSWPVVVLNIGWMMIAIFGLSLSKINIPNIAITFFPILLKFSLLIGLISFTSGYYDIAGFAVTAIYIFAYSLLVAGKFTNINYIWWCSAGYLILIPHLISFDQYSVLVGESIGFIIGLFGLFKFYFSPKEVQIK